MAVGSSGPFRRRMTPVSAEDVARVVARALVEAPWRLRLTGGQRRAILRGRPRPGAARA